MAIIENLKPFWPLLFTAVLPRAIGYYRALRTAYRTRPPPKPLPRKASRGLNILFVSICIFLWISTTSDFMWSEYRNVFSKTQTRLQVPTDVLFARLASSRHSGTLTALDEELRLKLLTLASRQMYLRYGPKTLLNCSFCHPDEPQTYFFHYFPTNILFPHLLHVISIGIATSSTLCGLIASKFRLKYTIAAVTLLIADLCAMPFVDFHELTATYTYPVSLYVVAAIVRPVVFILSNVSLAGLIYITGTGRFVIFPFLTSPAALADPEELLAQTDKLLNETGVALSMAHMKLRGLNVARNTIVRDEGLKQKDAAYWETVRAFESEDGQVIDEAMFEDEEVQAAMARAFGSGNVDVERMRKEAKAFVDSVTQGLEKPS